MLKEISYSQDPPAKLESVLCTDMKWTLTSPYMSFTSTNVFLKEFFPKSSKF